MSLVIVSESVKQNDGMHPAKELFRGTLFKIVKKLCKAKGYDYVIISLYRGIISPDQQIRSYETAFRDPIWKKKDVKKIEIIREKIIPRLKKLLPKYKEVIIIAGKPYREVLQPIWDERFTTIKSKGYGDLYKKIKEMI